MNVCPSWHTFTSPTDLCIVAASGATEVGHTGVPAEPEDPTDTADSNTFETMNQDLIFSPASVAPEPSGRQSPMPPPDDANESGTCNSEANLNVFIDCFPHGCPGAPLSSSEHILAFESVQNVLGDSIWVLFRSQCDWEIARWAKMHGPTSTALTELLAIPGVRERPWLLPLCH